MVISDWMMPRLDGLDLCRRVRALEGRPYIYFILLTAKAFLEDRLAGLGAGADDFLTKPLDRAELIARLNVARRVLTTQEELLPAAPKSWSGSTPSFSSRTSGSPTWRPTTS